MKYVFLLLVIVTAIFNMVYQTEISKSIDRDWNVPSAGDGEDLIDPLAIGESLDLPRQLQLVIPRNATLEIGIKGPHKEIRDLVDSAGDSIDVLFAGDS